MATPEEIEAEEKKKAEEQKAKPQPMGFMDIVKQLLTFLGLGALFSPQETQTENTAAPSAPTTPAPEQSAAPAPAPAVEQNKEAAPAAEQTPLKQATVAERKPVAPLVIRTYTDKDSQHLVRVVDDYNKSVVEVSQANAKTMDKALATPEGYSGGVYATALKNTGNAKFAAQKAFEANKLRDKKIAAVEESLIAPSMLPGDVIEKAKRARASQNVEHPEFTAENIFKQGQDGIRIDLPSTNGKNLADVIVTREGADQFTVAVVPKNLDAAGKGTQKGLFAIAEATLTREQATQAGLLNTEALAGNTVNVKFVDKTGANEKIELSVTSKGAGVYNKGLAANVNGTQQQDFAEIESAKRQQLAMQQQAKQEMQRKFADARRAQMHQQQAAMHGPDRASRGREDGPGGPRRRDNSREHPRYHASAVDTHNGPSSSPMAPRVNETGLA